MPVQPEEEPSPTSTCQRPRIKRRYRFREYTVTPDTALEAEPHVYAMQCGVCSESGPTSTDAEKAHGWVAAHLRSQPGHLTYSEHITRPYRAIPGGWL
ncbi:hypothetical protein [Streptomyces sulphureus]|uniref:DUF7848 domain-containing protein n=1 Tax=Streptomyces sulphureus TaxID=47758 RepID=UPI00036EC3C4|nr:hypothetical protein [Streptomyces sulphureus]